MSAYPTAHLYCRHAFLASKCSECKTTPNELRTRRLVLHLSQKRLAEVLGVSTSTVAHWEQGVQAIPAYLDLALQTLERNVAKRGA